MRTGVAFILAYAALFLLTAGAVMAFGMARHHEELRPCPPRGTHLDPHDPRSPLVIPAEDLAAGIYPIGRPFVPVECR